MHKLHMNSVRESQRGIALVAALILLVVVTLLGIGAIHSTTVQQKMSGNFYDRQLAFQSAEAALQAASHSLSPSGTGVIQCTKNDSACYSNPFDNTSLPANAVQQVSTGSSAGEFTAATNATGQPEYVVQYMGQYTDPGQSTGFGQTANSAGYGAQGLLMTSDYYRVTARSGDPTKVGARAVVTLQAYYKQQ